MKTATERDPRTAYETRSRGWSLAARLTAWYAGSAFAIVVIATVSLYVATMRDLAAEEHTLVEERLHILRVVLYDEFGEHEELREEIEHEWPGGPNARAYVRVLDQHGALLSETRGMRRRGLAADVFPAPLPDGPSATMGRSYGEGRFALYSIVLPPAHPGANSWVVQIAADATRRHTLMASYRRHMWLVLGTALIACAWVGLAIARSGMQPVRRIGETLSRIRSTTLHERLRADGLPNELSVVALTCNDMLDGLELAFEKLARFSADIAHELRTPLNNLRGEIEVALSRPRSAQDYHAVLVSCMEESQRMARLIHSLLFLARTEGDMTEVRSQAVNLGHEVATVAEFYEALTTEARITLEVEAPEDLIASVDRALFQSAIGNLVENAVSATPAGGCVRVSAERENGEIRIQVVDTGCGIAADDLPHVFDRLYRVDGSRARRGSGAGLGLAIVKGIARVHGGSVSIRSDLGKGTCVTLVLPARAENPPEDSSGYDAAGRRPAQMTTT